MEKKRRILTFAAVCTFCILLGVIPVSATTIPGPLNDIPLYEGSTVQQTMSTPGRATLTASVKAGVDDIAAFYKQTMTGKGWRQVLQARNAESMATFHSGTLSGEGSEPLSQSRGKDEAIMRFQKNNLVFQITIRHEEGEGATTYTMVMTNERQKGDDMEQSPSQPGRRDLNNYPMES